MTSFYQEQVREIFPDACVVKLTPAGRRGAGFKYILWRALVPEDRGRGVDQTLAYGNSIEECWKKGWETIKND